MNSETNTRATANDSSGFQEPGESSPELHWRLLAVEAVMGWVPPFVASRIRTQALRLAGVQIGKASSFWGLPTLVGRGAIEMRLHVGTHCGFNKGCFFDLEASINIGDHVAVGHDVMFLTRAVPSSLAAPHSLAAAPITIANGVWLGARSTILTGVTVGASSVIGAGVTVIRDVPENTLLTGAPPISLARWR